NACHLSGLVRSLGMVLELDPAQSVGACHRSHALVLGRGRNDHTGNAGLLSNRFRRDANRGSAFVPARGAQRRRHGMSTQRDKPSNTLMPAPIVSVIVIFLDEERFLREAIESILTQRFQDFELILVDDGSSDRSPEIARSYASQQPDRIRYVHHPEHRNRGMSVSGSWPRADDM